MAPCRLEPMRKAYGKPAARQFAWRQSELSSKPLSVLRCTVPVEELKVLVLKPEELIELRLHPYLREMVWRQWMLELQCRYFRPKRLCQSNVKPGLLRRRPTRTRRVDREAFWEVLEHCLGPLRPTFQRTPQQEAFGQG
mmetsp:Transcript_65336/g.136859  ORF Transcript_65336/g.136859 Transcript_65336/m.136859 type:complete len:139 (-) Transcript_65336:1501-1917(-)